MSQLPLPLRLADHAVFESFWAAGNDPLVSYLSNLSENARGPGCWIWGAAATGKTHLLQAVCGRFGDRAAYVPLAGLVREGPRVLDGLASREAVCIDDIDAVAGTPAWEDQLFDLCNQLADTRGLLVVSASRTPRECGLGMPDLKSRLSLLPAFHLRPLAEEERLKALQLRARHRGLELPAETGNYLLSRSRRDMASLYETLDRLDLESLKVKRRLTIPFVRDVLNL